MFKSHVLLVVLLVIIILFALSAVAFADDFEIPPYPDPPDGDIVTMEYAASYLLMYAGLDVTQLGVYPRDHISMAKNVGLFEGVDFIQGAECSLEDYLKMAANLEPLYNNMSSVPQAPFFYDGMAQPTFRRSEAVRFVVYVESRYDTDGDGKLDLIKAVVQVPKSALDGAKFGAVAEFIPYSAGTNSENYSAYIAAAGSTFDQTKLYAQPPARVPAGIATTAAHAAVANPSDWQYYYGANATGSVNCYTTRTSYDYYLARGFAVVLSAGRGTAQSEGISTCGSDLEIDGFKAIIDWLNGDAVAYTNKTDNIEIKADWSNGNLGMTGTSYGGTTQFGLAATGVKGLKAIIPVAGVASWYEYSFMQGAPNNSTLPYTEYLAFYVNSRLHNNAPFGDTSRTEYNTAIQTTDNETLRSYYGRYLRQIQDDQIASTGDYFDNHWSSRDYMETDYGYFDWSKIKAPAFIVHGTNDRNVRTKQSDLIFQTYKKAGVTAKLLWHQGVHTTPSNFQIGEYHYREIINKWWSRYLYNMPNGIENYPAVTWESSVDGTWYTFDSWESADTEIFKKDDVVAVPFTTINSYYSSHSPAISSSNFRNYFTRAETPHSTIISKKLTESYILKGAMEVKIRAAVDNLIISPEEYIEPEPDYPEPGRFSIYLDEEYQLDWDAINEGLESGDIEQGDVMGLMRDYPPASLLEELQPTPEAEAATAISRGDNLIISAMLVEISDTPFMTYSHSSSSTRTAVSGGIWYGDGMNNGNIIQFTQVAATQNTLTGKYYKEFAYGWMDLANPSAKYNSASAHRKDRVDLVPGQFYDYTLYLMPTIHTVRAGNELALVLMCQFPGQYGGPTNAQGHYTITIDNSVTGGNFFRDPVNTVTFLGIDGKTALVTQYIPNDNYINLENVPAIEDTPTHKVLGWYSIDEGRRFDPETRINKDYRLMPYLGEINNSKYTVTFDAGEHGRMTSSPTTEEVIHGRTVSGVPSIMPAVGYKFIGWESGIGGIYDSEAIKLYPVYGAMTFTAQYLKINDAVVVLDYNGGTDGSDTAKVISGQPGTSYTVPQVTRTGYTLSDWFSAVSGDTIGIFGEEGSVATYTAQWTVNTYAVTFNAGENGIISPAGHTESVKYGANVGIIPVVTAETGYVFIYWKSSDNNSVYTTDAVRNYPITKSVAFTAQYVPAGNATVIFDYNGGTANWQSSGYESGRPGTTYSTPAPTRIGYRFSGWSPSLPNGTFGAAGSATIYVAQWTAVEHTVTFNAGDNGKISQSHVSEEVGYGGTVSEVPNIEVDTGYIFIGWKASPGGIFYDIEAVKSYPVTSTVTFTAQYTDSENATVIFNYNNGVADGEISSYVTGKEDTTYNIPHPVRTGYSPNGWLPGTPSGIFDEAGTVAVYLAQWLANSYDVTFLAGANGKMAPESSKDPDSYKESVNHDRSVINVPVINPNSGYRLLGWSMNGGITYYRDNDIRKLPIAGETVFEARYEVITTGGGGGERETATLTVRAIDKANEAVISVQNTPVLVGETLKISAQQVPGYALAEDSEVTKSVTIKAGNNIVEFFYIKADIIIIGGSGGSQISDILETEKHIQYINGYPDGSVRPDGKITRAEVAIIFWRLLKTPEKNDVVANTFSDLKGDESYAQAVKYLAKIGILLGYEDGSFRPSLGITRAEFVAISCRFDDLENSNSNPFTDLTGSHWAYSYIISAYVKGWISGYPDGEFKPQNGISRAEVVKIVNCMLGRGIKLADLPADLPSYADLASSHWAYCEIMESTVSHEFERQEDGWEIWK